MSGRSRLSDKVTVLDPDAAAAPARQPDRAARAQDLKSDRPTPPDNDWAKPDLERPEAEQRDPSAKTSQQHTTPGSIVYLRRILQVLLPIAVLYGAFSAYQYLKATAPELRKRAKVERSFAVKTIVARPGDYQPMLHLYGTTTTGRQVDIRALVAGQVIKTGNALREGGELRKGDLLLTIDPFNFETARQEAEAQLSETRAKMTEQQASRASDETSLKHARAQLKLARVDLKRAIPLARRGTVSKRTVDDRRNIVIQRQQAVEQFENSIRVWDARIKQQEATILRMSSGVRRAARRLDETKLVAPFDSYVTQVGAQVGRIVSANDKVATLIDRNWIDVRFTLSDAQYGRIIAADKTLTGREVKVLWRVGSTPLVYAAKIERVGANISAASGGIEVYARIDDPLTPVPLRPGAFVEVQVTDRLFSNVYRLPDTALFGGDTVYAVENGRLQARKVKQVGLAGGDILVIGGMQPGDRIITTRLSTPGDGLKVRELRP